MKDLKQYLNEKLIVNKKYDPYKYYPTTWEDLKQIIEKRYKEQGPGTAEAPIDFNDIDVSKITTFYNEQNIEGIFKGTEFEYIDISGWDVSNVTNMNYMFFYCINLNSMGNISNWNVSNVKYMHNIFCGCKNLKSVGDLSKWNVSSVKNMSGMFDGCKNLKSVGDLSKWNISNVENMDYMFSNCEKLKSVGNLSKWNISNDENTFLMFAKSGITNIPDWYKK